MPRRHALIIHNPTAGRRRHARLAAVLAELQRLGLSFDLRATTCCGDAETIAKGASARHDVVVAAGGDGTVNEVANGLAALPDPPPLAVIPLGTVNLLAAEIGVTGCPRQIAKVIAEGRPRRLHLGTANGRHFVMMAGIGLDAQVVANVDCTLKRRVGRLAYVAEAVAQACRYSFPVLDVVLDDGSRHAARAVIACNGRRYGGPFVAAPRADIGEPVLQVVMLPRGGWAAMLRYGLALMSGRLAQLPEVVIRPARHLTVRGPAGAPVQGDGDLIATLPVEIAVAERALSVLAP